MQWGHFDALDVAATAVHHGEVRWGALLVVIAACGHPHYTLSAPPPTAAPAERMQAYAALRAAGRGEVVSCDKHGCTKTEYLVLGDGREIWHLEDTVPVLSPKTDAGEEARRLVDIRANRRVWRDVLLVGLLGGIATIVVGAKVDSTPVIYAGEVMVAGGLVIGGLGMLVDHFRAAGPRNFVLDHYDEGLTKQLNLCVQDTFVYPCDAPNAPQPPDPILRSLPQR